MFFDELSGRSPSPIVLVPPSSLYNSPSTRLQSRIPVLLSISYWNSPSLARFTTAVHYIITVSRALILAFISREAKQLDTLVSSPEFHLAVPLISHTTSHPHSATFGPTLIHIRIILKTNRPPIHLDSTVLLRSFCSMANAGLASSSNSSLYY